MASPSSIVTLGIGSWGSPSDMVLLGYGSGVNVQLQTMSLASLSLTPQAQQNTLLLTGTLAALSEAAQAIQNRLDMVMTSASMSFSVWALVTSAIGTARTRWKSIVGVVRGVIQNDEDR